MTALATIFALVPMALGLTGGGVFISKPLAIVVIGGLVSSTLLTLILVPVLYDLLENWRQNCAISALPTSISSGGIEHLSAREICLARSQEGDRVRTQRSIKRSRRARRAIAVSL